ncbi:MAG: CBS domain-containing protein [Candidatus Chloroheliales bacterium]|nr:MAG: CBS domain-containing protein [Chloroflexota bacterium]
MKVKEIMTKDVDTISPTTTIADVARDMRDLDVGFMPVVQNGELLGVITDRDITIRVTAEGLNPMQATVDAYYSPNVVTIGPDASVDEAAKLMGEHQIRRLLVTEGKQIVGVVSIGDVAVEGKKDKAVGETLTEISQPNEYMQS